MWDSKHEQQPRCRPARPASAQPASHQQQQQQEQSQLRARAIDDTNKSVKLPLSYCLCDCCWCSGALKTAKTIVHDCCLIIAKRKQHVNGTANGEDAHRRHFRFTALLKFDFNFQFPHRNEHVLVLKDFLQTFDPNTHNWLKHASIHTFNINLLFAKPKRSRNESEWLGCGHKWNPSSARARSAPEFAQLDRVKQRFICCLNRKKPHGMCAYSKLRSRYMCITFYRHPKTSANHAISMFPLQLLSHSAHRSMNRRRSMSTQTKYNGTHWNWSRARAFTVYKMRSQIVLRWYSVHFYEKWNFEFVGRLLRIAHNWDIVRNVYFIVTDVGWAGCQINTI